MKRLTLISDYTEHLKDADLVIEAVFEDINVKAEVYEEICKAVTVDCILASNTSSIPLTLMSRYVVQPERFAGLHFFSPVWLMQLVEIIRGDKTSQDTMDNLLNLVASIGKRPILCKDNPGFVVNAVLWPYFMDALDFLEKGNSIEKVDGAFVEFGMPLGPIKLIDEVGIDVSYNVVKGRGLQQETLKNVVGAGRLGLRKSGKGFYLKDGSVDPAVLPLIARNQKREITGEEMQVKVLSEMVKVGHDLLERGIVDDPRMIDIGMIWGTGFPADRGGPMHVINSLQAMGLIRNEDVIYAGIARHPFAYVVYDLDYRTNISVVRRYCEEIGIDLIGRFAQFEYLNMDGCIRNVMEYTGRAH